MYGRIHIDSNDDSRRQWTTDHLHNNTGLEPFALGELTSRKQCAVKFGKECFSDGTGIIFGVDCKKFDHFFAKNLIEIGFMGEKSNSKM